VPAKVQGSWQLPQGQLRLTQTYQNVSGTLGNTPINNGKLKGDQITFDAGGAQYSGRVSGNTIEGTVRSGRNTSSFKATRQGE
jgi:hypothetical protein